MLFYQNTVPTLTMELLSDAIFNKHTPAKIHYFNFCLYPELDTLEKALLLIDQKRQTLSNPTRHNFLCIELNQDPSTNSNTLIKPLDAISTSINATFDNDLFIINLIYQDEDNILHPVIILSDIEKSLDKTSETFLSADIIYDIITKALPDRQVESICAQSIFVFNGETEELSYDGVFHIRCYIRSLDD